MKLKVRSLLTSCAGIVLSAVLVALPACKDDPQPPPPEPTQKEITTALLTKGTWPLTSIVVEGEDASALFTGFSLTFTNTGYTTTGTTPVWARSGTWSFTDDTATKFKRDDNIEVTITSVDDKTLKLTLFWDKQTTQGGRTNSIPGRHDFILTK
jgi:hypothetical protein